MAKKQNTMSAWTIAGYVAGVVSLLQVIYLLLVYGIKLIVPLIFILIAVALWTPIIYHNYIKQKINLTRNARIFLGLISWFISIPLMGFFLNIFS